MKNIKSSHWSNYWQGGQLTSLPQDFNENYSGAIQLKWLDCFRSFEKDKSLLDLCTGNCAIALLASEYSNSNKLNWSITAVDAANVKKENISLKNPKHQQYLKNIKLIANTNVENIELDSNSFDVITSQYGIEYCNWEIVAQQIVRLLKKNGEFIMISHSGDTEIVKFMETEESDYSFLTNEKLFKFLLKYSNGVINYNIMMKYLRTIQPQIVEKYRNQPTQLLQSILIMLDNINKSDMVMMNNHKQELKIFCNQHQYAYARLLDLLRVTKLIVKNPNWFEVFIKAGLVLKQQNTVIYKDTINSGTFYRFVK